MLRRRHSDVSQLMLTLRMLGRTGNLANAMDPGTKLSGKLKWVESWDFLYGNSWRSCSGVICGNGWACGKIESVLDKARISKKKKKKIRGGNPNKMAIRIIQCVRKEVNVLSCYLDNILLVSLSSNMIIDKHPSLCCNYTLEHFQFF